MSEASALLTNLEKTIENSNAIIQALERIAQKQDENALALAKAIGESSLALGQLLERVVQRPTVPSAWRRRSLPV